MSRLIVRCAMAGIVLGSVVVVPQTMASGTGDVKAEARNQARAQGSSRTAAAAAAPAGVFYQEWLYPGPAGSTTCSAKAEYHDGRVKQGALKPEYYTINAKGDAVRMDASNPDYACNGYSVANANDVKAWSAKQYMTVSLADLASERKLTGSKTKRTAAVNTLATLAKNIGFTGVDVDFENYWDWSATDHTNFMTFIRELAAGLHAKGLGLQVEGPPDIDTAFHYGDVLAAGADEVVMMAYDLEYQSPVGDTCIAFAPYQWATYLIEGALAEIPQDQRHRFVAGLPSEAYTATEKCQNIVGNLTYADMRKAPGFSADPKVMESRRDPESGEIRWRVGDTFYNYVDQQALDSKLALVRGLGVDNVSVWVLGGGNHWFSAGAGVTTYQAEATANARSGKAAVLDCAPCSGSARVGHIGNGSTLTVNGVRAPKAGTRELTIAYTNGETTTQRARISVNGKTVRTVDFAPTGGYTKTGTVTVTLPLRKGANAVAFDNSSAAAPDIDAIRTRF